MIISTTWISVNHASDWFLRCGLDNSAEYSLKFRLSYIIMRFLHKAQNPAPEEFSGVSAPSPIVCATERWWAWWWAGQEAEPQAPNPKPQAPNGRVRYCCYPVGRCFSRWPHFRLVVAQLHSSFRQGLLHRTIKSMYPTSEVMRPQNCLASGSHRSKLQTLSPVRPSAIKPVKLQGAGMPSEPLLQGFRLKLLQLLLAAFQRT
jgi:hypothetical protein